MENKMDVTQKIKMKLQYDPDIPLLGIYIQGRWKQYIKKYLHAYIHCSIIHITQDIETNVFQQMNRDKWINRHTM